MSTRQKSPFEDDNLNWGGGGGHVEMVLHASCDDERIWRGLLRWQPIADVGKPAARESTKANGPAA